DVENQFADDSVFGVLEDAVAEAVSRDVRIRTARRQRRGRPEPAGLFIADIDRLAAAIADRVIVPRCQAKLVTVFGPGISAAAFAASGPAAACGITRATVCSSTRSSSDICSPRRTNTPPGLSTKAASGLAATRSMIRSWNSCR